MPLLGGVFIDTVYSEDVNRSSKTTDHPIESKEDVSDHVVHESRVLSFNGVITGVDAALRKNKIEQLRLKGDPVQYSYRNVMSNVLITNFKTTHDKDVKGGVKFNMTLKEIKIVKAATVQNVAADNKTATATKGNKGLQQAEGAEPVKNYEIKAGDSLSKIASLYNISTSKLYEKNRGIIGADQNKIYPGQKLVIPG